MPTQVISIGPAFTMIANVQYALPARRVLVRAQPFANIQTSNDGTTWLLPIIDAAGQFETAAVFIRDTVGGAIVKLAGN